MFYKIWLIMDFHFNFPALDKVTSRIVHQSIL